MNIALKLSLATIFCCVLMTKQAFAQTAGECVDTDGDGFGWSGTESCDPTINSKIPELRNLSWADVSADGQLVLFGTPDGIWLHDRASGTSQLTNFEFAGNNLTVHALKLSRDGRYIAYYGSINYYGAQGVYIYDIATKQSTQLVAPSMDLQFLTSSESAEILQISDDGTYIAYQGTERYEPGRIRVINRLTGELVFIDIYELGIEYMSAMSGDGRYVFIRTNGLPAITSSIYVFDVETGIIRSVPGGFPQVLTAVLLLSILQTTH